MSYAAYWLSLKSVPSSIVTILRLWSIDVLHSTTNENWIFSLFSSFFDFCRLFELLGSSSRVGSVNFLKLLFHSKDLHSPKKFWCRLWFVSRVLFSPRVNVLTISFHLIVSPNWKQIWRVPLISWKTLVLVPGRLFMWTLSTAAELFVILFEHPVSDCLGSALLAIARYWKRLPDRATLLLGLPESFLE